jgi:hypothetical protein
MSVNIPQALRAGVVGWIGMTGLITLGRRRGVAYTDLIGIEGAFFAEPDARWTRTIGRFFHLGMCLWIAFAYALGFKALRLRPSWKTGALASLIHWALASLVVGLVSTRHPRRVLLDMPGYGGVALGRQGALSFLLSHVVYGTLVGWQYGQADEA